MKLLVLDTETTGVDPAHDRVIEIAAAIYDTTHKTVLWQLASLVPEGAVTNPAEHINGISVDALKAARGFYDPFEEIDHYAALCDVIIAHNAAFDRRMTEGALHTTKPWICSQRHLTFPKGKGGKLTHLAADHGILVTGAHRAMADVMMIVELLRRLDDIEEQVRRAQLPHGLFAAKVAFEQKDLAKAEGFTWNTKAKRWERELPLSEPVTFPFKVERVYP